MSARPVSSFSKTYGHLWFVLPGFAFFLAVMIFPLLFATGLSMTNWSGLGNDVSFIGLANYVEILTHWPFYRAAMHNAFIFLAILVFQHTVGLYLAVLLNEKPRFMQFYRTVLFLPVIMSLVATGFVWTLMLSPNIGLINPMLEKIGLGFLAQQWLSNPTWALIMIIMVTAWNSMGWAIIIYLAGLQNVPEELRQAAEMDGANSRQVFWRVVFPQLSPAFTALTVLTFIGTFRTFDVVYVLTGPLGAPNFATDVLGTLIYRTAFGGSSFSSADIRFAFGVAMALLTMVIMAVICWGLIRILRKREIES
ncbi:carbohydrate ABC transporter permease [Cognatishimia maritima]|uniref:Multiple sugar transport system permease protein n=1 Tax=Cognatishimia maritima TaxID=870908 RepID=A0A1M5US32_9RHOB|nr:sugar ABC transporter permease [Cognatishimia maritima]SHH65791.1 multiple sugar transport system permease protein [Cognatishimia maritima]